ncbi:MAG: MFS transporter [Phycicoccus sp.]|nr:MFS transporter [Phycicoccus sp.]
MTADPTQTAVVGDPIQRRTIGTLVTSQILGGVGLSAGVAVGALLAEEVSGSPKYAGLGSTFQILGSALIAIPVARLMARHGRRPGLAMGYTLALVGGIGLIVSGIIGSFALLLACSILLGGATTSNSQARYVATDLAPPDHRARQLSIVVWSTTIGSVLGPNLVGPSAPVARWLGIPILTGPFVFSVIGLALAIIVVLTRLRPDPLLEAHRRAGTHPTDIKRSDSGVRAGLTSILATSAGRLGLLVLALGHAVMVSVMVMTPLHMRHGHAELTIIGLVISVHILGMFAFSPITGWAADRYGSRRVAIAGSLIQIAATVLAAVSPQGSSWSLALGLFLLGLGWSCTLVSGSTLLVNAVPLERRAAAQGASDLVMGLTAATSGAVAGVIVDTASFAVLALVAVGFASVTGVAALLTRRGVGAPAHKP